MNFVLAIYLVGMGLYLLVTILALRSSRRVYVSNWTVMILCILFWPFPVLLALGVVGRGK